MKTHVERICYHKNIAIMQRACKRMGKFGLTLAQLDNNLNKNLTWK